MRDAIRTLPKETLEELYEAEFARISRSGQQALEYATVVFSLLLCAQEILSPEALIQAMAAPLADCTESMTTTTLLEICSNLIVLDTDLNALRFSHVSFYEFLLTKEKFAPHNNHRVAALSCLDTCFKGLPTVLETDLYPRSDFRHYSALYWPEHCRLNTADEDSDPVVSKMKEFVFDEDIVSLGFVDWIELVSTSIEAIPKDHALARELHAVAHSGGNPLYAACVFGLYPIIERLANAEDYEWTQKNEVGQSGLYLAAAAGRGVVVQSLLRHDVNVNDVGGKLGYALHAACFGGYASTVELLLKHDADPKLGIRSAFEYAVLGGHEDIALLLVSVNFDIPDEGAYNSALQQAAEAGFADLV